MLGHVWCGMWLLWSLGGLLWSESGTTWRACLPQFPAHCTIADNHSIPPLPQVAKTRVRVAEMKAGLAMMQAMHRGGWVGGLVGWWGRTGALSVLLARLCCYLRRAFGPV